MSSRRARDAPVSYCEEPWKEEPALKRSKRAANPLRGRPTLTLVYEHDVRAHPATTARPTLSAADVDRLASQDCSDHDTGNTPEGPHQEGPDRISAIHKAIAR